MITESATIYYGILNSSSFTVLNDIINVDFTKNLKTFCSALLLVTKTRPGLKFQVTVLNNT